MSFIYRYNNIAALANTSSLNGDLAYVNSLNDFYKFNDFVIASVDGQDVITGSFGGFWTRMFWATPYWKNKLEWFINNTGDDEAEGTSSAQLKTNDEFLKRTSINQIMKGDYSVNIQTHLTGTKPLNINFSSGSISYVGTVTIPYAAGAISYVDRSISYNDELPAKVTLSSSPDGTGEALGTSTTPASFIGWSVVNDTISQPQSFPVSQSVYTQNRPQMILKTISLNGNANINFTDMIISVDDITIDAGSTLTFTRCKLTSSNDVEMKLHGYGKLIIDQTKIEHSKNLNVTDLNLICSSSLFNSGDNAVTCEGYSIMDVSGTTFYNSRIRNRSKFLTSNVVFIDSTFTAFENSVTNHGVMLKSSSFSQTASYVLKNQTFTTYDPEFKPKFNNIYFDTLQTEIDWDTAPYVSAISGINIVPVLTSSS